MSPFVFKGRDSIIVAIAALRIVSITGIANRAKIAPANPVVPSMVLFYSRADCAFRNGADISNPIPLPNF